MRIFSRLVFVALTSFASNSALAHQTLSAECEHGLAGTRAITLSALREMSIEHVGRNLLVSPQPGFDNAEEQARVRPVGEVGPMALQQIMGPDQYFVSIPAPTTKDAIAVNTIGVPGAPTVPVHVDVQWAGQRTSTAVYVSVPAHVGVKAGDMVPEEFPVAVVHLHGGGTPTTGGQTADKVAEHMNPHGVPVLAMDLPGHGLGPRQLGGFEGLKQQADWALAVADKFLHPTTKIVLSGHSYGGMIALFMHRLSKDPKYKRIVHYIPLSPGVDPTLGGSGADRIKWEKWYQKNYKTLKKRMAESDFDFLANVLANGKDSDVGSLFTTLANLDYSLPELTTEEYAQLAPLTVAVGTADGLVYVGFEEQFEKLFGNLPSGSRFIKLGRGPTFKGNQVTGHQLFDRYIATDEPDYIPGKDTPLIYTEMTKIAVNAVAGAARPQPAGTAASPSQIIDAFWRNYGLYFGFRQMVAHTVEYADGVSSNTIDMAARQGLLKGYLAKIENGRTKGAKKSDEMVAEALNDLRQSLGIKEMMTLESAKWEAGLPELTATRRAELEQFQQQVREIEERMSSEFKDEESDRKIRQLTTNNSELLSRAGVTIESIKPKLEELIAEDRAYKSRKASEKAAAKARGEAFQNSPDEMRVRAELDRFRADLGELQKQYLELFRHKQQKFFERRTELVAALVAPAGVTEPKMAGRELKVDWSPERRAAVAKYLEQYDSVVAATRAKADAELAQQLESIKKPDGVVSIEDALIQKTEVDSRKDLTWTPHRHPEIQTIVTKVAQRKSELSALIGPDARGLSLTQHEGRLVELFVAHAAAQKAFEEAWKRGEVHDSRLPDLNAQSKRALAEYQTARDKYNDDRLDWLASLDAQGKRTAEVVLAMTPELFQLRARVQETRKEFLRAKSAVDSVKNELLHAATATTSAAFKAEEARLEERRRKAYLATQAVEQARAEYIDAMIAANEPIPLTVNAYHVFKEWDRPLAEVRAKLEHDRSFFTAMVSFLSRWESFATELRRQHSGKTDAIY